MSNLNVESSSEHGTVLLTVCGEVDLATQDVLVSSIADNLLHGSVLVDLAHVDFLAISALDGLLRCERLAETHDRRLVLCHATPPVRLLLEMSGVDARIELDPPCCGPPARDLTKPRVEKRVTRGFEWWAGAGSNRRPSSSQSDRFCR